MTTATDLSDGTDELLAVVRSFTRSLARSAPPADGEDGGEERVGRDVLRRLLDAGLWNVGLPDDVDGQGAERSTTLRVVRELATVDPTIALVVVHAHTAGHALAAAGDRDAARRIAAGEVAVVAFASPGPSTVEGGWTLPRVDLGLDPDRVVVIGPDGQVGLLDGDRPDGVPERRTGLRALAPRRLVLPAAPPAAGASVGGVSARGGADLAATWWSLGVAACALGAAGGALDRARSYVATRRQFGAPLADLPTIARAVAVTGRDLDAALLSLLAVASTPSTVDGLPAGLSPAVATVVRHATNVAVQGCLDAVQLLGGYGYLQEYAVEGFLRDAVSLRAAARLVS